MPANGGLMIHSLAYGQTHIDLNIPEGAITRCIKGHEQEPIKDIRKALLASLASPIGSRPLDKIACSGMKVCIIVSDNTRLWMRQDLVVPPLVDYLLYACNVKAADITILIANGTHQQGSEETLRSIVTDAVFSSIKTVNHDAFRSPCTYLGTTSLGNRIEINSIAAQSDLIIALGCATHHVMAGFGGGRKSILPGISSASTIGFNHALCLDKAEFRSNPAIGNGKLEGNPCNLDMCEAASLVPNLFVISLVMNTDMKLCYISSGHWLESWLAACRKADELYSVSIEAKADVIIASCGGYPKDMSLYQGTKAVDNIENCLKRGGTLILAMEAKDKGGPAEYFGWAKDLVNGTMERRLRERFTVAGYIFLLNTEQARRYDIRLITSIDPKDLEPMGIKAFSNPAKALEGVRLEGRTVYLIDNATTVMPREKETR
jgi:nickel-dependent lactate racemase